MSSIFLDLMLSRDCICLSNILCNNATHYEGWCQHEKCSRDKQQPCTCYLHPRWRWELLRLREGRWRRRQFCRPAWCVGSAGTAGITRCPPSPPPTRAPHPPAAALWLCTNEKHKHSKVIKISVGKGMMRKYKGALSHLLWDELNVFSSSFLIF